MPVWDRRGLAGTNTAWEALLALPEMIPYITEEEGAFLNELDSIYKVERRDPAVRRAIREVLRDRGMH